VLKRFGSVFVFRSTTTIAAKEAWNEVFTVLTIENLTRFCGGPRLFVLLLGAFLVKIGWGDVHELLSHLLVLSLWLRTMTTSEETLEELFPVHTEPLRVGRKS